MDQLGKPGPARVPHAATSWNLAQAADSIRKLAALEPAAAWPGHMGPLTGDVRAQLLAAAEQALPVPDDNARAGCRQERSRSCASRGAARAHSGSQTDHIDIGP
jgi:hypothetical protein